MLPLFLLMLTLTYGADSNAVRWSYCDVMKSGQEQDGRKVIKLGIINGRATKLPHPKYPVTAKAAGISGEVRIEVTVDEMTGKVIEAKAISGPQLLLSAAIEAAKQAEFTPSNVDYGTGTSPSYIKGILVYTFKLPRRR